MSAVRKSPEWLAEQRSRIGGSNSAASVGRNPHKTRLALYHEIVLGQAPDLEHDRPCLRGNLIEPVVRERARQVLDLDIIEHDQNDFVRHTDYYWAQALPDGWVQHNGERIPIEIKVPDPFNFRRLDAEVPDYIRCQVVHNAAVLAVPALLLCCMDPVSMDLFTRLYEPAPDETTELMEAEREFWVTHVIPRVPPPPSGPGDFKLAWPTHVPGTFVETDEVTGPAYCDLVRCKTEQSSLTKRIEELSNIIKMAMGDKEVLASDGTVLATWRSHAEKRLDSKKLKQEMPIIWNEYAQERNVRVFLPKGPR